MTQPAQPNASYSSRPRLSGWLLLLLLASFGAGAQPTTADSAPPVLRYKQAELTSTNLLYEVQLMQLALEKTRSDYGDYQLEPIHPMNRARSLAALSQDIYPNLVLLLSYEDSLMADGQLSYIPISLDRGIFSYRLCFMRDEIKPQVEKVRSLEQLRRFTFGSGLGWADSKILRHNGLNTLEADTLLSLYRMTKAGRIDLLCRGVGEYYTELHQQGQTIGLSADSQLIIYYPLPKFLFAHKNSQALLERIETGLRRALEDGSFDKLWHEQHNQNLNSAQLKNRRMIILDNPLIQQLPKDYQRHQINPLEH